MEKKPSLLRRIFAPRSVQKSFPTGQTNINTTYSNENEMAPISSRAKDERRRGIEVYSTAQVLGQTGRTEDGSNTTVPVELPYFYLTPIQRNEIAKLSTPVLGIVSSRMQRISGMDFSIVPIKHREDLIVDELKMNRQTYREYENAPEVKYIIARGVARRKILNVLPECLPDLSNFDGALLRWKKRINNATLAEGENLKDWMQEPNAGVTWEDYIKKVVFNLMVHGSEGTFKQWQHNRIENFDSLPGGTIVPIKHPYFSGQTGYVQAVPGFQPQIYFSKEMMYMQYLPTSIQSHSLVPLEALINKIAEGLLFDKRMAEEADGTKPPEKLVVITNNNNPYTDLDKDVEDQLPVDEQKRIETKLNEPRKHAIVTFAGNQATVVDLSRADTMAAQNQRQKDIREEVALVFNMSNMEINLTGSGDVSGRSTSESQAEIEQGKGITPIVKLIEKKFTKEILPFRSASGGKYMMEYDRGKNEKEQEEIDRMRLDNGKVTINELREEENKPRYDDEQFDKPRNAQPSQPGADAMNPMFTRDANG